MYKLQAPQLQHVLPMEPFHVWTSSDEVVGVEFYRLSDGFLMRYPGEVDLEISSDGLACSACPVPGVDRDLVDHLFSGHAVPLMLNLAGKLVFHASSVEMAGGAIAFLGDSGMGKSTLAAYFAKAGRSFLSDDFINLQRSDGGYIVDPCDPSLRLLEPSVRSLVSGTASASTLAPIPGGKTRVQASQDLPFCSRPRRLLAAFFLRSDNPKRVEISPITGASAHLSWIASSFQTDVVRAAALSTQMDDVASLSIAVPSFDLDYPRNFACLPKLHKMVETVLQP